MELQYKKDFSEAKKYWEYFWNGEILDRPLLLSTIPKNTENFLSPPPYMSGIDGNFKKAIELFEEYAENTIFFAERIPYLSISFGPDEVAYFLKGAEKNIMVKSNTAWIEPFIKNWDEVPTLEIDKGNNWYKKFIEFYRFGAEKGDGKFLLEMADFHTHLDCLRAIRGTENLCFDLIERPEEIDKRLNQIKRIFPEIYNDIYTAGNMEKTGTIGWIPFYCEGRYAVIQCDFICMIGKEMFRRFALPYIEEEASFLDHCIFHLDGPGALTHLDDILSIKKIDAIQWVPGGGNKSHIEWMELFKKIKNAGKSLIIYPQSIEEIKIFHKELGPEKVVYEFNFKNLKEAEDIKNYLKQNT